MAEAEGIAFTVPGSIAEFIEQHGLEIQIEGGTDKKALTNRPILKDDDGWEHYFYTVRLRKRGSLDYVESPWRAGTGHAKQGRWNYFRDSFDMIAEPPAVEDILDSMASDSSTYENTKDFSSWADEYGYDTNSRKAERTSLSVVEQAHRLRFFLGGEAYEQLLWKVERL